MITHVGARCARCRTRPRFWGKPWCSACQLLASVFPGTALELWLAGVQEGNSSVNTDIFGGNHTG